MKEKREIMELISIIIPIYNGEKYLNKCLDSVAKQTYTEMEVILINDGSIDSTEKICKEYCKKNNKFRLISSSNMGASHARNIGIDNAKRKIYWIYRL